MIHTPEVAIVLSTIKSVKFDNAEKLWSRLLDVRFKLSAADFAAVIDHWILVGEIERARKVFNQLPELYKESIEIKKLEHELLDFEETEYLGESVYPGPTTHESRWKLPKYIPTMYQNKPLLKWFPGRVVEINPKGHDEEIIAVIGIPAENSQERITCRIIFSHKDWDSYCNDSYLKEKDRWIILTTYGDSESEITKIFAQQTK